MAKAKLAPLHVVEVEPEVIKLDIGCGKITPEGWVGMDAIDFGQKHIADVRKGIPYPDNSISEVRSSHFVEHLTGDERVAFFNELYRVMKVGAVAHIVTPHWSNACAYGDPTHQWPPMSEWYAYYLNKDWRDTQAPHTSYTCNFDFTVSGSWDGRLQGRNPEFTQMAMGQQINAWRDLIVILTKKE